jgi:hypothetical protein
MARQFRFEYIRDVVFEQGDTVHREEGAYDAGSGYSPITVIFRAKDDGKFYEFEYGCNSEHGVYTTEGWGDDKLVTLPEVEERVVTTTTWVRV